MNPLAEIAHDLKALPKGERELRKFGLLVGGVFLVIGCFLLAKSRPSYPWFCVPGAILVVAGALVPALLRPVYVVWMGLALALGFIVSHIVLTGFFFCVITPIGLIARLVRKDFLRLKIDRGAPSYWLPRNHAHRRQPTDYERQF